MRVHVLRRPATAQRQSRDRSGELVAALRGDGHQVDDITATTPAESSARLRAVLREGSADRIVVSGGDGSVHLAIQELAESDVVVAIDPSGTGNDFATALGLRATDSARITAPPRPVDLVRVSHPDGRTTWVASIAIAGFPAAINERANRLRLPIGSQIYTVAAAIELPRFARTDMTLRLDGHPIAVDSAMLAIGNTKLFGGGMLACPDALPDDGLLHLTSINDVDRRGILRHLLGRAGGTADRPEVLRRTALRIDIDTPGIAVWGDGEPIGETPLTFEIVPEALMVAGLGEA